MNPKNLLYSKSHEWAKVEGQKAVIGITHFAQEQLGDITYVDLPQVGTMLEAGKEMGSIESVKAASELYSPVSGKVVRVNEDLASTPEKVNQDPYGDGWMVEMELSQAPAGLLNADEYEKHAAGSAH